MRPGVSATVLALGVLWLGAACTGPTQQQPDLDVGAHVLQVCRAVGTPIPYAIDLPQVDVASQALPEGVDVQVHADQVWFEGVPVPTVEALKPALRSRRLELDRAQALKGEPIPTPPVLLGADGTVPAARVASAVRHLTDGGATEVRFVVWSRDAVSLPDPPDKALYAEITAGLDARSPEDRPPFMAEKATAELEGCEPANDMFRRASGVNPEGRCEFVAANIGGVLDACPRIDRARIATLLQIMTSPTYTRKPGVVAVSIDPEGTPVPVRGSWSSLAEALVAHDGERIQLIEEAP